MAGESARALQSLQSAIEAGWSYSKYIQEDPELERLREYSSFQALVRSCEDDLSIGPPTVGFDARKFYYPNGVGGGVVGWQCTQTRRLLYAQHDASHLH